MTKKQKMMMTYLNYQEISHHCLSKSSKKKKSIKSNSYAEGQSRIPSSWKYNKNRLSKTEEKESRSLTSSRKSNLPITSTKPNKETAPKIYSIYLIPFSVKEALILQPFAVFMMPVVGLIKINRSSKEFQESLTGQEPHLLKEKPGKEYLTKRIKQDNMPVCYLLTYSNNKKYLKINLKLITNKVPMFKNNKILIFHQSNQIIKINNLTLNLFRRKFHWFNLLKNKKETLLKLIISLNHKFLEIKIKSWSQECKDWLKESNQNHSNLKNLIIKTTQLTLFQFSRKTSRKKNQH